MKMVKIGSFWVQNDVIGQNLGKVDKIFFTQNLAKHFLDGVSIDDFDQKCR